MLTQAGPELILNGGNNYLRVHGPGLPPRHVTQNEDDPEQDDKGASKDQRS